MLWNVGGFMSACCSGAVNGRQREQKQVLLKLEVRMQRRHSPGEWGRTTQLFCFHLKSLKKSPFLFSHTQAFKLILKKQFHNKLYKELNNRQINQNVTEK